jgi:5-oxopent-3-ene-1,2,5-tricarboxylate decarboxylase / 2-hydroxyhepta-2,4-diene-1,7-dioate isomerase
VSAGDASFLAPVEPSKIIVHLTYRSRVDEYAARIPGEPGASSGAVVSSSR